jgi:F-type H+-transporting ATPase subunit gamma
MPNLEEARKRFETAGDLLSVVKMMKALAAANIREYEQAGESLEGYLSGIMLAFRGVLHSFPASGTGGKEPVREKTGMIVFGSDQGMCGQFNDRIAAHAQTVVHELGLQKGGALQARGVDGNDAPSGGVRILAVGQRAADRLAGFSLPVEDTLQIPTSPAGMTPAVLDLIRVIDAWNTVSRIDRVLLLFNRHTSGAMYEPLTERLLPLDREWLAGIRAQPWPTHVLPVFRMDAGVLFSSIVRHYLIASLYRAFAESLASENASRLAAMQGAEKNIRDRIVSLRSEYHHERQVAITEELLDIISGFITLEKGG